MRGRALVVGGLTLALLGTPALASAAPAPAPVTERPEGMEGGYIWDELYRTPISGVDTPPPVRLCSGRLMPGPWKRIVRRSLCHQRTPIDLPGPWKRFLGR